MRFHKMKELGSKRWTRFIEPYMPSWHQKCCTCGLVHEFEFRVVDHNGRVIEGAQVRLRARRTGGK